MTPAETNLPPLDVALARANELTPHEQLAAMNRVLNRNPALETSLASPLSEITSGETLVAAMRRRDDPTAQSLSLLVVTEVDPTTATSLFAAIDARFKAAMDRCVAECLAALPETSLASLASARDVRPATGPTVIAKLSALYDTAMYGAKQEDGPYELEAFGHGADGVVRLRSNIVAPFVEYLRATMARGGFASIDRHERGADLRARLTEESIRF